MGEAAVLGAAPAVAAEACPEERRLSVMNAHVLLTNRRSERQLAEVRAERRRADRDPV